MITACTATGIARTSPWRTGLRTSTPVGPLLNLVDRRIRRKPILAGLINEYEHAA
jgi:hypothetical protein